jgi:hypothetical protein
MPPPSPVALAPQRLAAAGKPHYPSWFSPLASAAERRPVGLLLGLIAVLLLVFSAGAGLGYLVKQTQDADESARSHDEATGMTAQ